MKKIMAIVLITIMIIQMTWALPASWSQRGVYKLNIQGVLVGKLANSTQMQNPITREEFAEMAVRLYMFITNQSLENLPQTHPFVDTSNPFVGAAYRLGIVNGTSKTTFAPNQKVTREQIATMLYRELTNLEVAIGYGNTTAFSDAGQISDWALVGVTYSKYHGLVKGTGNNNFSPKSNATREQVFTILDNILTNYKLGLTKPAVLSDKLNEYQVPLSASTQLVLSEKIDKGISLRIQSGISPTDRSVIRIEEQWLDVYDILIQKWSYKGVEALALQMKSKWDGTNLKYNTDEVYYLTSTGNIQTTMPSAKPYILIRYQGILVLDIMK
jgi:hypothetical protein